MSSRLDNLREKWIKRYDAYLLYKSEAWISSDIRYLTGFTGSTAIFLQTESDNFIFVDSRYKLQVRREAREGVKVVDVPPGESPISVLAEKLSSWGVRSVAVEGSAPIIFLKSLRKLTKGIRFYVVSGLVSGLRVVKEDDEIERIRKAQKLTDELFEWVLNNVRPGQMTEKELALEMEIWARKRGAEGMSFPSIVAGNERSAMPHARPTDNLIPTEGVLLLDFGVKVGGYVSDMTRTVWIGRRVSDDFSKVYNTVLEAQKRAIEKLTFKRSWKAKDVDAAARNYIDSTQFKGLFGHGLGHGVGMDVHEAPYLSPKSKDTLRGNEVVTVEPGIYIEGKFGVRIEDMVVTGNGENLTRSPKEILTI